MKLGGVCILTNNAPRLVEFYKAILQQDPFVEGSHYSFGNLAVYDPGDVKLAAEKNIWLQCFHSDIDTLYARLLREIPGINIISPPERKPWGTYSFQFTDPDGNKIAVAQVDEEG